MKNKEFIVAGIKNLLKRNYGIDPQTVDVDAYTDSSLNFGENWTIIKEMINVGTISYHFLSCKFCNFKIKGDWTYCPKCGIRQDNK